MNAQLMTNKLYVALGSVRNYHKMPQLSQSAKLEEMLKPEDFGYVEVKNLLEAKELVYKYIQMYDLGASNWTGGRIIDEHMNFVAAISYNGRVWDDEDYKKAKEIEVC